MDLLSMSKEELNRLEVMGHLQEKRMGQSTAAKIMGVSVRQVKRLLRAYRREGEAALHDVLREVQRVCRVQKRFFLAGFSAGAEFAQAYAFDNPKSVSAVAVLSSGNYIEPPPAARGIPFLAVIGDQDDPVGLENARSFTDSLKQAKFTVELVILPGVGHRITPRALELAIALFQRVYAALP